MSDPVVPMHLEGPSPLSRLYDNAWKLWVVIAPLVLLVGPVAALFAEPPKPVAVPSAGGVDWATNPQAALGAILESNQRVLNAYQDLLNAQRTDWVGWAVGAVGIGIGFLKVFNGPAGALAEGLWAMIAPKLVKDAEAKRDVMADGFLKVAEIMRSFPPNTPLSQVIDKLDRRLPEAVKKAYREWEANEANDRPAPVPPAPVVNRDLG